jgi:hypothetical protein
MNKRQIAMSVLCGMVVLGSAGVRANLLGNGGFEEHGGNGVPVGWGAWASVGGIFPWQNNPVNAFKGNSYVELQDASWAVAYYHNNPVKAGTKYYFSAMIRKATTSTAATPSAELKFEFYGGLDKADSKGSFSTYVTVTDQWKEYTAEAVAPAGTNYITTTLASGGAGQVNWFDEIWIDSYKRNWSQANSPDPADGAKVPLALNTLAWNNPDPNDPQKPITCTVWISDTYSEYGKYPDDPNFLKSAVDITPEPGFTGQSVILSMALVFGRDYFWRIDCTDPSIGVTTVGRIWKFTADNTAPKVNAGPDLNVWLSGGTVDVTMNATASDDGRPNPPGAYTLRWAVAQGDSQYVTIHNTTVEDPVVTITAVGTYGLDLLADDGELTGSDTVTIRVFENACQAAKAAGVPLAIGDLNADCRVNMEDLAALAANWLVCTSYVCP